MLFRNIKISLEAPDDVAQRELATFTLGCAGIEARNFPSRLLFRALEERGRATNFDAQSLK
jgi:hypothetical protein